MALGPVGGRGGGGFGGRGLLRGTEDGMPPPVSITNRRMLGWFYTNLAPHWGKIALGFAAMLVSALAGLKIPLILRSIFDDGIANRNVAILLPLSIQFLVFTLLSQGFGAIRTLVMHLLGQRFVYTVRTQCYDHLLTLGLSYFHRQRSGDIMSRVSNDVGAVEDMVVHGTDDIISNLVNVVGAIGIMLWIHWKMALVALAPMPVFVISLWFLACYIRPVFNRIRKELGDINAKLQERIAGIQVIKSFAREEEEKKYFDESNHAYWRQNAKSIWIWSTYFPMISMITSAGLVVLIWYGAREAASGEGFLATAKTAGPGTVVAFLMYMQRFYQPIGALARVQNTINRCLASIARIFELLDEKPSVADKPDAVELGRVEGRVDIESVGFRYDTGETVLKNISVSAAPGETVAIVGRSGAGKSSLVSLIPRFYDPTEGRVLVDGKDLRDVTQASLRRNIGIVLQDTFLFNTTIRENIRYARADATDEEIEAAARRAHAHEFVLKFENGYDTVIGERGVRLSGGEKQRLSIARALLSDPRILILDEATSMVDTEAEQIIQAALTELMRGRTTFVIAHRLSTVRKADKICVIEGGEIVEQDDHDGLMARRGRYADMVSRQMQFEDEWGSPGWGSPALA
ncbi:ABC transporter ATP-binding protein [Candidatus Sumerlaeota bacterium]|nr:ABC transporter ATP-binding protein [Candidatus Sumerlaeota bacterium]